jgi:hypothetical protein
MRIKCLEKKPSYLNTLAKYLRVAVLIGLLFSGLLIAASSIGFADAADAPTTQWSQTYGGTNLDDAVCVIETSDGGYALTGNTQSFGAGSTDAWLIKTDQFGNELWNKNYGGPNNDVALCVVVTNDGGYAIAGCTYSFGAGSGDFWLIKTDAAGTMLWSKTYGGTNIDGAYCIVQTSDGGYALTGSTASFGAGNDDAWLIKTDQFGNELWNKNYGGTNMEEARCVVVTSDGGYALTGYTTSYGVGSGDFWLIKTDAAGNTLWTKTYGGTNLDAAFGMVVTSDGGYALAGLTSSFGAGGWDFWLVKTDASGTMHWSQTYGGANYDYGCCVVETIDGAYALAGPTGSFGAGSNDFWLIKTAPDSLLVLPESAFGALGALAACIAAMAIIATNKKHQNK